MNVAKQMVLGLDSTLYCTQQFHTAGPDPRTAQVPVSNRRRVGDEDIRVLRNRLPLLQTLPSPWYIERPIAKLRLPVEEGKPAIELLHLASTAATSEVSGMHKNITIRDFKLQGQHASAAGECYGREGVVLREASGVLLQEVYTLASLASLPRPASSSTHCPTRATSSVRAASDSFTNIASLRRSSTSHTSKSRPNRSASTLRCTSPSLLEYCAVLLRLRKLAKAFLRREMWSRARAVCMITSTSSCGMPVSRSILGLRMNVQPYREGKSSTLW
ncbi:hypothetical protein E2C01_000066 [Portunus trituberculatus]|uniref:Uncharacterized protein n=1 Tax=Portunus trituberculatus TaxID=210409 RepID=A0A5B7CFB9_PORTR|nr:hypothetical protein [Portunus trituberculatus]